MRALPSHQLGVAAAPAPVAPITGAGDEFLSLARRRVAALERLAAAAEAREQREAEKEDEEYALRARIAAAILNPRAGR